MKRKIVVLFFILVVILIALYNRKKIYNLYKMKELEKEYISFLDGKFQDDVALYHIEEYNRLQQDVEVFNHYDITELIESYIDMLEKSCELYKKDKAGEKVRFTDPPKFKNYKESEMGKDIIMRNDAWLQTFFDITDDDILNYNNGTFTDSLINELKKSLEYEIIDNKIRWEINSIDEETIELPYNCYLVYSPYKRIKINEFKCILDVEIKDPVRFDYNEPGFSFIIKYEDLDGSIKYIDGTIRKHKNHNGEFLSFDTPFWPTEVIARATLKSHTGDRREDEAIAKAQILRDKFERMYGVEY